MADLNLQGICKNFGAVEVLKGVDLVIENGEFVVLVGPSGCGKSTLLRCIAGLEFISGGDLQIGGKKVNNLAPKDRDIAMVFQSYALYPHMTVRRNMAFGLEIRRMPREEIDKRVDMAADLLGLENLLERYPRQLSGGQRQRVAMGRAIVRRPSVFLFDEPLSNLDAALRVQMRAELARLHQRMKTTMIYVTHDQVEAMTLADKMVVLNLGEIQQVGPPLDLYHSPANRFVAGFIGSPSMNFMPGTVRNTNGTAGVELFGSRIVLPPGREVPENETEVELGIRPEHLHVVEAGKGDLSGVVEIVEPMGWDAHVHISISQKGDYSEDAVVNIDSDQERIMVIARAEAKQVADLSPGTETGLSVSPESVHLFDAATGKSIGRPVTGKNGEKISVGISSAEAG